MKYFRSDKKDKRSSYFRRNLILIKRDHSVHLMILPAIVLVIIFNYIPIYGITIAFQRFNIVRGYFGSEWVGLYNIKNVVTDIYFWKVFRNTVTLSAIMMTVGFIIGPVPLALLMNEVKHRTFKKAVQTASYLPYFLSTVVLTGMIMQIVQADGFINSVIMRFGGQRINFLMSPQWFRPIYFVLLQWKNIGFGTIIYLAALSKVSMELYESANIDGASRFQKVWHITLPAILPTIIILQILGMPGLLSSDFEVVLMIYRPAIYETADVISTYVYRRGLLQAQFSYGAAMGLLLSIMSFILIFASNKIAKKVTQIGL